MASPLPKERDILIKHYAKLTSTVKDVDNLLPHFVTAKIINSDDVDEIKAIARTSERVGKLLKFISGPLDAGFTKSFYKMLDIIYYYGNDSTKELAIAMGRKEDSAVRSPLGTPTSPTAQYEQRHSSSNSSVHSPTARDQQRHSSSNSSVYSPTALIWQGAQEVLAEQKVMNKEQCPFDGSETVISKQFSHNGGVMDIKHCGLKVIVPERAIEDDCVEIQAAVSLFGPFDVPRDCRPVSPYLWIAANYVFKRKLRIEFQHHADVSSTEDASNLCVLKACCTNVSIRQMYVTTVDHYVISDKVCTLLTDHFCSYCLASKSDQVADRIIAYHYLPADYKLASTFKAEICFCYDLNICKEVKFNYIHMHICKQAHSHQNNSMVYSNSVDSSLFSLYLP